MKCPDCEFEYADALPCCPNCQRFAAIAIKARELRRAPAWRKRRIYRPEQPSEAEARSPHNNE